jgi:hypothetical protein
MSSSVTLLFHFPVCVRHCFVLCNSLILYHFEKTARGSVPNGVLFVLISNFVRRIGNKRSLYIKWGEILQLIERKYNN